MKVLVTGCAGFIGSFLCERLVADGIDVVGVDALTDYYDPRIKLSNLELLKSQKRFSFIHRDIVQDDISDIIRDPEYIFHLSARPGVRTSWGKDFDRYVRDNVIATQRLLEAALHAQNLKKFVFASSSSVYGQFKADKVKEDHPTQPFSPYGVTKLAAEQLCEVYAQNYGLNVTRLRLFTVYGPRQRPDMAFAQLMKATLRGSEFIMYGDGNQERDYTYIDDVVESMKTVAFKDSVSGVFNIGGGEVVSLNAVVNILKQISGKEVQIKKVPRAKGDVQRTSADTTKSRINFGFNPRFNLVDGLRLQFAYMTEIARRNLL